MKRKALNHWLSTSVASVTEMDGGRSRTPVRLMSEEIGFIEWRGVITQSAQSTHSAYKANIFQPMTKSTIKNGQ